MGILNILEILKGFTVIPKEIMTFIRGFKTINEIKKIKAAHNYSWLNEYLKNIDLLKEIILDYQCDELTSEVPITAFAEFEKDMLQLYFFEILLSHAVKQSIVGNTYVFQLTPEYIHQHWKAD